MFMSDTIIINCSPRKNSTSDMLSKRIMASANCEIAYLYEQEGNLEFLLKRISGAKTLVFIGPCYVNTFPAETFYLLEELSKNPNYCRGQRVYGVINGGMPYVHTHDIGLKNLKMFCQQNNMLYSGGFVIGGGPMLNGQPLEKHISAKKLVPAFDKFTQHIINNEESPDSLYVEASTSMPRFVQRMFTIYMNMSINKKLKQHGFSPKQRSPYLD